MRSTERSMTEVELLKKQMAEEVKEKYGLYKRITELNEKCEQLEKQLKELMPDFEPGK